MSGTWEERFEQRRQERIERMERALARLKGLPPPPSPLARRTVIVAEEVHTVESTYKLNNVSPRNHKVLAMRRAGFKYREIAEHFGISIDRARQIVIKTERAERSRTIRSEWEQRHDLFDLAELVHHRRSRRVETAEQVMQPWNRPRHLSADEQWHRWDKVRDAEPALNLLSDGLP